MVIQISALSHADIDSAIECIQQAFAHDPYALWVFDRTHFNATRNHASLRTRCLWGIKHAVFHVAHDPDSGEPAKVLGVSCWLPPALAAPAPPPLSWVAYSRSWLSSSSWAEWFTAQQSSWGLWFAQLATNAWYLGRGGLNVRRYYVWKEAQATAQRELWDDPAGYYFCNIVTVLPEMQGRGVGRLLMTQVLQRADMEGRKCYLESSRREPNVEIYRRMGFRLVREMLCEEGGEGITLYCMTREPKPGQLER